MNKYKKMGIMLSIIGVLFIVFALFNPEYSFPWSNTTTYLVYVMYIFAIVSAFMKGRSSSDK